MEKKFPEHMVPLENRTFNFSCHSGLECFTTCCKNVDMHLFPYDIIRLKNALGIDSETFLRNNTKLIQGNNPFFPSVMMKLLDDEGKACPFLLENGCSVYTDRPSSCRTYPLERAVDRAPGKNQTNEYYFLTNHNYCLGHKEMLTSSVKEWVRNQRLETFNMMNDLWAEIDSIFLTNPWKGEGSGGPKQQLAFMVCYNIDAFRKYMSANNLLQNFRLSREQKTRIGTDDSELLKFGFQWLKHLLTGKSNLITR
jgi:Fe-S-cluster containining protein